MKDNIMKAILLLGTLATVAACSLSLPVAGQMADGTEKFTGTATGYSDGGGDLTIVSNKGRSCSGKFVYTTGRSGGGVFNCSDGQSGPFNFVSTGTRGTGTGTIGGKEFTFSFG